MTEANKQKYNLIQQYLEGSLDPGRMHELEKEALEDPFLAEALEGYSAFEGSAQPHLSLLQRQLEARIAENAEKKNIFYFTWQRISVAAAASLLFISASILFWMKGTNTDSRLAGNAKNVEVTLTPGDELGKENQRDEKYTQNKAVTEEVEALTTLQRPGSETKVQPKVVNQPGPPAKRKVTESYAARPMPAPIVSDAAPKEAADVIAGQVVVNEIATASARIASVDFDRNATAASSHGQVVSMRGTKASYSGDSGTVLNKAASRAISPVSSQPSVIEHAAQPVDGWENYQMYISQNKRLPAPGGDASAVVVIFTVDKLGRPDTCRIEKGINERYNAEAIRLLKEGPLWKANRNGRQVEGYIQVDFK
ncbi:hypothetical protein B0I27_103395 [Arcticibacter pallidicorallinus]|uniref:TonB family protein n=1 Tax=Arcticibacter pallidicorallinus TaxID=1259464 RepID=A0A2T0U7R9_9SPHI|nr:hypothetical protein [Arcticibacter pallidicorallinus]PRY53922.1 hypothetical protein B0I27_103395 [Arcticibacter pallidicorallinus]